MQNVLVVGATSAIAEATCRLYAARGARLCLAGRNTQRLNDMADDLRVRGAQDVAVHALDVNDIANHAQFIESAWQGRSGMDVVLIAHGTLPDQTACETSAELSLQEFATNATSTIALLTPIANRMQASGKGTIAVISSVAGDRGRASNYLYGSAKAAVTTFLSGLRQRLYAHGVHVLTIKPGFVDTPMTRNFKKGALWAKPDAVATGIVRAIDRKRAIAYLPGFWALIMLIIRCVPEAIFKRVKL
ncbi:SDR family oxidoreductase [Dyella amyloliquefaciens]|uniref:SDR family oxidoreductase n=1 Tax=Dyella amyloliquefaciens TaxID=1770545 RepID=UPI00102E3891|nr:SDR family oxidoreductase [Dyella amyloliquefaciens]